MTEIPKWALKRRQHWKYVGSTRPDFADEPGPGQESVWDYPRPPRVVQDQRAVTVSAFGYRIASTTNAYRLLETASPPTFYVPVADLCGEHLIAQSGTSRCEWKGLAKYWGIRTPDGTCAKAAWSYPEPFPGFEAIRDYLAFYPGLVECYVDEERVEAQPGGVYGGWVTAELVGPFKGPAGTEDW